MAPEIKVRKRKLQRLDVVVTSGPTTSEVHLASPEALQWVERNVALERRVIVSSVTWPNSLADDVAKAMEKDGLTVGRQPADAGLKVEIIPNVQGTPPSKLADAELEFTDGPLEGLRLVGFAIWERQDVERVVTFPARQYSVNGERRSFALLRTQGDIEAQERVRDLILQAFADYDVSKEGGQQ